MRAAIFLKEQYKIGLKISLFEQIIWLDLSRRISSEEKAVGG
jgi:hypothetical protein